MNWLSWLRGGRRRRSPFNNWGSQGLTCGRVSPHLLVGGELGPDDWRALMQEGVSVVINLQQEQQDFFASDERLDASLWLPSPDGLAPTLEQIVMGVDLIDRSARAGNTVFVHCKAGQGRAPLLCACYLIRAHNLTPLEAVQRVRQARARTQLTPEQNVRLREYAAMEAARNAAMSSAVPDSSATVAVAPIAVAPNPVSLSTSAFASEKSASEQPMELTAAPASCAAVAATDAVEPNCGPPGARLKARAQFVTAHNGQSSHTQSVPRETTEGNGSAANKSKAASQRRENE